MHDKSATQPLTRAPQTVGPPGQGWTPLSYARAKGKYGPTEEAGIYAEVGGRQACAAGREAPARKAPEPRRKAASHALGLARKPSTQTRVQDVLSYYGAKSVGDGPPVLGVRSPRASFDPEAPNFGRERGSYQREFEHP